jgi:hypothetical protein
VGTSVTVDAAVGASMGTSVGASVGNVYLDVALVKYYGKAHIAIVGVRIGYTEGAQALAGFPATLVGVRSCWRNAQAR